MMLPKNKVRIALPTICRKIESIEHLIAKLLDAGYKKWEIGNYWGLSTLPVKNIDLSFDSSIYMFNKEAMQAAKELGVSRVTLAVEDTIDNISNLVFEAPLPVTLIVYQDIPLFISAVCVRDNLCKNCSKDDLWMNINKDGQRYKLFSSNCQTMVFAERPYSVIKESKDIKADFYRVDFCHIAYTPENVKTICDKLFVFEDISSSMKANMDRKGGVF